LVFHFISFGLFRLNVNCRGKYWQRQVKLSVTILLIKRRDFISPRGFGNKFLSEFLIPVVLFTCKDFRKSRTGRK